MENPFVIGKAAEGEYFINRTEDRKRLEANLTHGINTIIISPRRWGKTSLVKKVMHDIDTDKFITVFIDVFRCKSEYEFYRNFATCIGVLPSFSLCPGPIVYFCSLLNEY